MTKTQIIHILNKLDLSPNIITHLPGVNYIAIDKGGNVLKVDYASIRFNFNTNKDYMEVIFCRPYSRDVLEVPTHGHYDILNDKFGNQTVFEYLVDVDNNVIKDYYTFEAIDLFSLNMPYAETFAIRWLNWDDTLLQLDDEDLGVTPVYSGTTPTRPDSSTHSFTFDSWSPAPQPATSNQDYVATFTSAPIMVNIGWLNWDNSVLLDADYPKGEIPIYSGPAPTRPDDENYTYVFNGWSPTPYVANADQDYVAVFDAIPLEGVGG